MAYYKITVKSHLNPERMREFGELAAEHLPNGCTLLRGNLVDQSQLFALLMRLRDMGVELLEFTSGENL